MPVTVVLIKPVAAAERLWVFDRGGVCVEGCQLGMEMGFGVRSADGEPTQRGGWIQEDSGCRFSQASSEAGQDSGS